MFDTVLTDNLFPCVFENIISLKYRLRCLIKLYYSKRVEMHHFHFSSILFLYIH